MYAHTHNRLAAAGLVVLASLAAAITADLAGPVAAPTIHGTRSIAADAAMPVTELPEVVIIGRREDA
jgi:hypothetical protein